MVELEQDHFGLVHEMEFEEDDDDAYPKVYPSPLLSHIEVSTNQLAFFDTIRRFHSAMGTKFMIPVIGGKELNLHRLYVQVTRRGGLEKVILEKRWREVIATFSFPPTTTSASFVLRRYYLSLLHHYEQVYFFRTQGPLVAAAAILQTKSPLSKLDQCSDPTMRNKRSQLPRKHKVVPAAAYIIQGQECLDSDDAPLPLTPVESKQAAGVNGVAGSGSGSGSCSAINVTTFNSTQTGIGSVASIAASKSSQRVVSATPHAARANKFVASIHAAQASTAVKRKLAAGVPATSCTVVKAKKFAVTRAAQAIKRKPADVVPATINAHKFAASSHGAQAPTAAESKTAACANGIANSYSVASAVASGERVPPMEPLAVLNADGIRIRKSTPPAPVHANTTFGKRASNVECSAISNANDVCKTTVSNANGIRKSTPPGPMHVHKTFGEHLLNGTDNLKVSGTINGKFEYGYLVSVKLGTEILNGVLYHAPPQETAYSSLHHATPPQPPPVASLASINSPSNAIMDPYIPQTRSVQRNRKYKNRPPGYPKPNRSAYNFFFAEMHAKLKTRHPHKERQYSKMIGESWGKLTAEERKVYDDYGKRDKERYQREKKEYEERTGLVQPRGILRIREPVRETEVAKFKDVEMVESK